MNRIKHETKKIGTVMLLFSLLLPLFAFGTKAASELNLMPNMTYAQMKEYCKKELDGFEDDDTVFSSSVAAYYESDSGFEGKRRLCADSQSGVCDLKLSFTRHLDVRGAKAIAFAFLPHGSGDMTLNVGIYTKKLYTFSATVSPNVNYGVFIPLDSVSNLSSLQYINIELKADSGCSFKIDYLCTSGERGNTALLDLMDANYSAKGGKLTKNESGLVFTASSQSSYIISDKFSFSPSEYQTVLKIALTSEFSGKLTATYTVGDEEYETKTETFTEGDGVYRFHMDKLNTNDVIGRIKLVFNSENPSSVTVSGISVINALFPNDGDDFTVECTENGIKLSGGGKIPDGCEKILLCRISSVDGGYETCAEIAPSESFEYVLSSDEVSEKYCAAYVGGGAVLKSTTPKFPTNAAVLGKKYDVKMPEGKKGMTVYLAANAVELQTKQAIVPVSLDALLSENDGIECGNYRIDKSALTELDCKISALLVNDCAVNIKLIYSGDVVQGERRSKYISVLGFLAERYTQVYSFTLSNPLNESLNDESFGEFMKKRAELVTCAANAVESKNAEARVTVPLSVAHGTDCCDFLYSLRAYTNAEFYVSAEIPSCDYDISQLYNVNSSPVTVIWSAENEDTVLDDYKKFYENYIDDDRTDGICLTSQTDTEGTVGLVHTETTENGTEFVLREDYCKLFCEIDGDKTVDTEISFSKHEKHEKLLSDFTSCAVTFGGTADGNITNDGIEAMLDFHAFSVSYIKIELDGTTENGLCIPITYLGENCTVGVTIKGKTTTYGKSELSGNGQTCLHLPYIGENIETVILSFEGKGNATVKIDGIYDCNAPNDKIGVSESGDETTNTSDTDGTEKKKSGALTAVIIVVLALAVCGAGGYIFVKYVKARKKNDGE